MNPLVKKEIRLLLPSWIMAVLLALVQAITRPYDFYVASLLFFGLTVMALTTIGREASLNTFSMLLAQPAERTRLWQTKLAVLAIAFLSVFLVWLAAFGIAFMNSNVTASDRESSYNLFIAICLIATATFTGGLWTTLLLRQIAGAFWLTLLVPAVLSGFAAAFFTQSESNGTVIGALCVVIAVYSVGGFLFARRLFFRAQDVGWTGGIIALPEWKFFARRSENAISPRRRKPIFALLKKEFQLQQVSLMGAAGLLLMHIGIIVLRKYHHFAKDSAGEILTSIFWMLWLVIPVVVGGMAVAEERRLGVMEEQLCLPVSRRVQFLIKGFLTLFLGVLLGGAIPMLLENIAVGFGAYNPIFNPGGDFNVLLFSAVIVALTTWLGLVSFFASTLARSFLQAVGLAIATFIGCAMIIPALTNGRIFFLNPVSAHSVLLLVVASPTIIVTLFWLAYRNFNHFRPGLPLWRRNLLGFAGALVFTVATSAALYHRVWEVFEPMEPAHGPAQLSLANPPTLQMAHYYNLLVRLPDGRVWFDYLNYFDTGYYFDGGYDGDQIKLQILWHKLLHPLPESAGPEQFVGGSNWVAATTERIYFGNQTLPSGKHTNSNGYFDTVGIQPDGTLWVSGKSEQNKWTADSLQPFSSQTNWMQLAQSRTSVVLLKKDGTLWRWGAVSNEWTDWTHQWPGLRNYQPYQIGTNSDWSELFTLGGIFARRADGHVWRLNIDNKTGKDELGRATNLDEIVPKTASGLGELRIAFVRADGTLWVLNRYWNEKSRQMEGAGVLQIGKENDWRAVAVAWGMMVALKADGSLWQWNIKDVYQGESWAQIRNNPPTRLGIHSDWVAITSTWNDVIALAADGSLWLWPNREQYDQFTLLKLPKQPEFLGNVFSKQN